MPCAVMSRMNRVNRVNWVRLMNKWDEKGAVNVNTQSGVNT